MPESSHRHDRRKSVTIHDITQILPESKGRTMKRLTSPNLHKTRNHDACSPNRAFQLSRRHFLKSMLPAGALLADGLQAFLENVTLDNEREDEEETRGDAVTLITMHSCKGLEFPHVYVVGLEDGLLPHSRSKVEGTLDEERRLFYVAITRAMNSLTLSHCSGRKKYGQLMPCHPSSFLKELPEHLVQPADELAKQPVITGTLLHSATSGTQILLTTKVTITLISASLSR